MSKINQVSCDCDCGEITSANNVFWLEDNWCILKHDSGNDLQREFHFKSLEHLNKWLLNKRINNE